MSCGCGGGCSDKIAALETLVKVLEDRIFSIEARIVSAKQPRNAFMDYPDRGVLTQEEHHEK